jgi:hypothetical protein
VCIAAAGRGGGREEEEEEEEVSLGVIRTNAEFFHVFHINSLFNLHFFQYFPYLFTIQLTFLPPPRPPYSSSAAAAAAATTAAEAASAAAIALKFHPKRSVERSK